jgi:hypothetical protein
MVSIQLRHIELSMAEKGASLLEEFEPGKSCRIRQKYK